MTASEGVCIPKLDKGVSELYEFVEEVVVACGVGQERLALSQGKRYEVCEIVDEEVTTVY